MPLKCSCVEDWITQASWGSEMSLGRVPVPLLISSHRRKLETRVTSGWLRSCPSPLPLSWVGGTLGHPTPNVPGILGLQELRHQRERCTLDSATLGVWFPKSLGFEGCSQGSGDAPKGAGFEMPSVDGNQGCSLGGGFQRPLLPSPALALRIQGSGGPFACWPPWRAWWS